MNSYTKSDSSQEDQEKSYLDDLIRLKADFENYKKRIERERFLTRISIKSDLIIALIPILESIEQATRIQYSSQESLEQGFKLINSQLLDALGKFGLERIRTKNQVFDPRFHEAVSTQSMRGIEEGIILSELSPGYTIDGRILKPAKVIVAADSNNVSYSFWENR